MMMIPLLFLVFYGKINFILWILNLLFKKRAEILFFKELYTFLYLLFPIFIIKNANNTNLKKMKFY